MILVPFQESEIIKLITLTMYLNYLGPIFGFSFSWILLTACGENRGLHWLMASWLNVRLHFLLTDMTGDIFYPQVPGAGERHSTRDKGHEEGGSAYAKAGSSLGSPPRYSRASTPKNQSLPTLLLCALTSDFPGGCPPPPSHSLCQRANLQLQLIKFLGN